MNYTSTRNTAVSVSAATAIATGISADGGLFVPTVFPALTGAMLNELVTASYRERAKTVLSLFLTDFTEQEIEECVLGAYGKQFDDERIAPVHPLEKGEYLLELWHGPTCAFKDMALQILPHLMRVSVGKTRPGEKTVILVATSGDTGKAALEGFKDAPDTGILVFYPEKGVSEMQRLQMITQEGKNVGVCAIKGNFDNAQTGVKSLFTNTALQEKLAKNGLRFSSANSINWGRLLPQVVYYISAYADLVKSGEIQMGDAMNVVVPTGNFGNILAAYYAKRMGLPIGKLICASNKNRVLTDFFATGTYNTDRPFYTTTSPSMDILISSNLERLLFHLCGENSETVCGLMDSLKNNRSYTVPDSIKKQTEELFAAGCATDEEVAQTVKKVFDKKGYLCDTHTAVALTVYENYRKETGDTTPTVIASTANPYKFAPAILEALGKEVPTAAFDTLSALHSATREPVPSPLLKLRDKAIRFTDVCEPTPEAMEETVLRLLMQED